MSGSPASGCNTFGVADFIRVPAPAAKMTTATCDVLVIRALSALEGLRLQDSNLDLTAPKAVVLPLHQGGPPGVWAPR